jgi:hypothetical protein
MPELIVERREILNREDAKNAKPGHGKTSFAIFASSRFDDRSTPHGASRRVGALSASATAPFVP